MDEPWQAYSFNMRYPICSGANQFERQLSLKPTWALALQKATGALMFNLHWLQERRSHASVGHVFTQKITTIYVAARYRERFIPEISFHKQDLAFARDQYCVCVCSWFKCLETVIALKQLIYMFSNRYEIFQLKSVLPSYKVSIRSYRLQ